MIDYIVVSKNIKRYRHILKRMSEHSDFHYILLLIKVNGQKYITLLLFCKTMRRKYSSTYGHTPKRVGRTYTRIHIGLLTLLGVGEWG